MDSLLRTVSHCTIIEMFRLTHEQSIPIIINHMLADVSTLPSGTDALVVQVLSNNSATGTKYEVSPPTSKVGGC